MRRGSHRQADRASEAYLLARQQVARYLNVASEEVVFTSGTTSAINGFAESFARGLQAGDEIIVSQLEHHSNLLPWIDVADRYQLTLRYLPVDQEGGLALSELPTLLNNKTRLLAITHASNVTGAISDVVRLVSAARSVNAKLLLDGAQMATHGPLDLQALGVDAYVFSGHKCYGPNGIGVLWVAETLLSSLTPFAVGGGMVGRVEEGAFEVLQGPARFEAGTPAIAQAVGLGAALNWLQTLDWPSIESQQQALMALLIKELGAVPGIEFIGSESLEQRLPILSFVMAGCHPHDLCHVLNDHGVALRGGHLCAQPLLEAMGQHAVTRLSLGVYNDRSDIDQFLQALQQARKLLL